MILYPNNKYLFLFLAAFLLQASLVGQEPVSVERTNNKVILEGKVYYIHVVKPGETLYAISKAYNVSQKQIAVENPGVISGLQIAQSLKIPVDGKMQDEVDTSDMPEPVESGKFHTVQRGETLYGISRIYELKEEDVENANPGVHAENLKPGQRLRIPEKEAQEEEHSFNEEGLVYHKVKRKETLYSIAGYYRVSIDEIRAVNPELGWGGPKTAQVIRIPAPQLTEHQSDYETEESGLETYQYDELDDRHANIRRSYKLAFFIPFDFKEMEPLDSLIKNVKSETRKNRIIERYLMEQTIPQSLHFLEFFQGTLLAIDSMRECGMKMDVRYFDTRKSESRTRYILSNRDLEDFDLFIGPFYPYNLSIVSEFSRKHRIPLVTPFYDELDLLAENPYLFQLSPSFGREYREAAKLVASKHNYNIVYVRQNDSLDAEKHEAFKQLIFDGLDDYHPSEPVVFKEVIQKLNRTDEIIQSLSSDKPNLVVVPTADEALASSVVSSLFYQLDNYKIEVLGAPYWTEFTSIDFRYYHKLNLVFFNPFWVDYYAPGIDDYMRDYRNHFYSEPGITSKKGVNYGILGYDMTFYFLNALRKYGPRFILSLDEYRPGLVQGPFQFERISGNGGYENAHTAFYQFLPDMTIKQIDVPDLPLRHYFFRPMDDQRKRKYLNKERR
jgi:LysM repeat protein